MLVVWTTNLFHSVVFIYISFLFIHINFYGVVYAFVMFDNSHLWTLFHYKDEIYSAVIVFLRTNGQFYCVVITKTMLKIIYSRKTATFSKATPRGKECWSDISDIHPVALFQAHQNQMRLQHQDTQKKTVVNNMNDNKDDGYCLKNELIDLIHPTGW